MTQDALRNFQQSRGWTIGADASVTLLTVGATANMTTATAQQPIIGYVLSNRGLLAGQHGAEVVAQKGRQPVIANHRASEGQRHAEEDEPRDDAAPAPIAPSVVIEPLLAEMPKSERVAKEPFD